MSASTSPGFVTVITIFLQAEKYLDEAIASVLGQSYPHWEYLLVDDGSSDRSGEIAQSWARRHPDKIRYLEHPGHENRGMSASRNRGLREAAGDFVAFLDADDVWLPTKLEEQLGIMQTQPSAAMIYGRTQIWFSWTGRKADRDRDYTLELGVPDNTLVQPPKLLLLLLENKVQNPTTCSAMIRRGVFAQIGGFQDNFRGMFEDQAFFIKLCLRFPVFVAGNCWARYRQHPDSCCAQAEAAGTADAARLPLLQWAEDHLKAEQVTDPTVWQALQDQLRPFSDPARSGPKRPPVSVVQKLRSKARRLVRAVFRRESQL